jgi:hypothetical protein
MSVSCHAVVMLESKLTLEVFVDCVWAAMVENDDLVLPKDVVYPRIEY